MRRLADPESRSAIGQHRGRISPPGPAKTTGAPTNEAVGPGATGEVSRRDSFAPGRMHKPPWLKLNEHPARRQDRLT